MSKYIQSILSWFPFLDDDVHTIGYFADEGTDVGTEFIDIENKIWIPLNQNPAEDRYFIRYNIGLINKGTVMAYVSFIELED